VNASVEPATVQLTLDEATLAGIADRVLDLLEGRRDGGFLDVDGAAEFLGGCSRKTVYHLVQRGRIRAHRVGGRLLFDRRELRADVERGE
jgi:excisionase family DNA binding protein